MKKIIFWIYFRYLLIFVLGIGNLYLFYSIFTPITTFLTKIVLSLFGSINYSNGIFYFDNFQFILSKPCIAGAAYYLLFIIIMSCSDINLKKRIFMIVSGFLMILFFNLFRIVLLANIYWTNYYHFFHLIFWYILSILFVIFSWFILAKIFKIKEIPFISDFYYIKKYIKNKKGKNVYL